MEGVFPAVRSFVALLYLSRLWVTPSNCLGQEAAAVTAPRDAGQSTLATTHVDILSDTQGVDFGPYVKKVIQATYKAWLPIIPESGRPPSKKQGRVGIRFKIDPNGRVNTMVLEFPCGDVSLDRAAWGSIVGASPYPPLPAKFKGPFLELRLYFSYNIDPTH